MNGSSLKCAGASWGCWSTQLALVDFKGIEAKFDLEGNKITLTAPSDFQVNQMLDVLDEEFQHLLVEE